MIIGLIHRGSGIGDQLFSYIATRVRAADLGVDFGFVGKEFFKGASFMDLDWGKQVPFPEGVYQVEESSGKVIMTHTPKNLFEINKPYYDPEFNFIPDGSVIDGYGAQDSRYFEHRLDEIREWLKALKLEVFDHKGIINFRGGEYQYVPDLFLPKEYWDQAIKVLREKGIEGRLEVHTDDRKLAQQFFPETEVVTGIDWNWLTLRYAKNAIISNSAFAIIPRLLKHSEDPNAITIAPKFWAGRNVGEWRRPGNYYKRFQYI